ncbi:Zinc finger, RING-CH-type [Kalmanozyma brasiliensis GHG001]|uniref:RING-type E3 ubiquitin transferase n=1 Tax=Kalmanozyma brasiliensis (strain GHG001) TaxID=1365824 RepID=V5EEA8_KALBG|nr:Zinc finger, RING-CH-type [Kalmanozyma brasiliensis GHG001]EST08826.1 Zinc finger, RING-CH-type [Kalmanozyma brasiliensis GHG001]
MEDEDSCRICRSGPEPGAPLYYPCKCTGSIRYCHQDCLVEWLQHSRKKYCELCNHPFIFHKKYRRDMPSDGKLPRYLYVRRLAIRAVQVSQLAARALLVGFTWLAFLPYVNINAWRFMFWSIDVAAWMGVPGATPPFSMEAPPANRSSSGLSPNASHSSNSSASIQAPNVGRSPNGSIFQAGSLAHTPISTANLKLALSSFVEKLAHDVFEGQILSCVIVVFFVGVFLLREWILQNMPQNFDNPPNQEGIPQPQPPLPAEAAAQQPAINDMPPQLVAEIERRRREGVGEQRRINALLDQLHELETEEPTQEREGVEAESQGDELDLDPEAQRAQAREARIRRLAQGANGQQRDGPAAAASDAPEAHDATERQDKDVAAVESIPKASVSEPSQLTDESFAVAQAAPTQDLQQTLGWSEGSVLLQDEQAIVDEGSLQSNHAGVPAGPSVAISAASSEPRHAHEDLPEAGDHEQLHSAADDDDSKHTAPTSKPEVELTAEVGTDSSPAEVAHTTELEAAAEHAQGEQSQEADEADAPVHVEADEEEDAWEDESDGEVPIARDLDPLDDAALRAAAAAAFPPPIARPVAEDEIEILAGQADDPEAEIGLAEEMDGILEAVGMRGPLFGIVQNLFLMIFLCGFVMLAFVMAPYVVGRLLGSGPGLVKMLALPVKLLRYVTDPVFDALIALGANSVWPKLAALVGVQPTSTQDVSQLVAEAASTSTSINAWIQKYLPSFLSQAAADNTKLLTQQAVQAPVAAKASATAAMLLRVLPVSVTSSPQWKAVSDAFDVALATGMQGTLRRVADHVAASFVRLDAHRIGTSSTDRIFCVAFGHCYWLLILLIHQHFSKPDLQRAVAEQSAFKMFMDQHVLIIKAISFIFIELIVFPLGCGLLFDICTMPFFAEASVMLWPDKVRTAPLSFAFTRWMGGTIYMFIFAQYVSATRKVLRPGVFCWIRDPNDPSFHPIREILDKKTLTQLRKIGASAIMYAAILVASVGVNTYFMRYVMAGTGLLPLRWKPFDPLTEVPIDLLMVHFALPWATQRIDPEKVSDKWFKAWWKAASRALRLSSYMIGGEFWEERRRPKVGSLVAAWNALLHRKIDNTYVEDGGLCRVPADDKAVTSGPLIIPLKADGTPPTERLAEAITNQEADAEKHTPKPTYTKIYLPSNYRARITTILTLLWLSHSALFILGLGIPLFVGRGITAVLRGRETQTHDFYSYTTGLTLLLVTTKIGNGGRKMWMRRTRRAHAHQTSPSMYLAIHVWIKVKRLLRAAALLVGVAGLVPLTFGLLIDQYVLVPLRYRSTQIPVLHLGQIWACGVIETRLIFFLTRFFGLPETGAYGRFMSNADHVVRGGLYPRPKVEVAWKRIVLPVVLAGSALLLAPISIAHTFASRGWVRVETREQEQLLLRKVFGAIQSIVLVAAVRAVARKRMESWTDLLKDEVFLESTELKNYEEKDEEGKGKGKKRSRRGVPVEEEDEWVADVGVEEGEARGGRGDEYVAEGTLPDVMFR